MKKIVSLLLVLVMVLALAACGTTTSVNDSGLLGKLLPIFEAEYGYTVEVSLWPEELGITAEADSFAGYTEWYVSANTGMGACLVMAEEMGAYILTDKATFLTFVANDGVM
jgi:ABC-type tungstate transport system permease subunit